MSDNKFPLGVPINRNESKLEWAPSKHRGIGWFVNNKGEYKYIEPPKKTTVIQPPYLIGDWTV